MQWKTSCLVFNRACGSLEGCGPTTFWVKKGLGVLFVAVFSCCLLWKSGRPDWPDPLVDFSAEDRLAQFPWRVLMSKIDFAHVAAYHQDNSASLSCTLLRTPDSIGDPGVLPLRPQKKNGPDLALFLVLKLRLKGNMNPSCWLAAVTLWV